MSFSSPEAAPLNFVQWIITAVVTALISSIAFIWRLMSRMDKVETTLAAQIGHWESRSAASETALYRLAEHLAQIHDDYFRLRENINGLPTRNDLRDLEDRVIEQLANLAARLDRALDA